MPTDATVAALTQQALAASARRDAESAIALLQRAVESDGAAAVPRYLLGAEYAQIGLVDKAVEAMEQALARDPSLATARLQLGLLHLGAGRVQAALDAWSPLAASDAPDAMTLFARGLCALALERMDECRALLAAGIALEGANAPLNDDMRKVLAALHPGEAREAAAGEHVLLGAYRRS